MRPIRLAIGLVAAGDSMTFAVHRMRRNSCLGGSATRLEGEAISLVTRGDYSIRSSWSG